MEGILRRREEYASEQGNNRSKKREWVGGAAACGRLWGYHFKAKPQTPQLQQGRAVEKAGGNHRIAFWQRGNENSQNSDKIWTYFKPSNTGQSERKVQQT